MYSNQFIYARTRRRFGRQCMFSDRNELLFSIQPSARLRTRHILRNPQNAQTQLSGTKALSVMVTENVTLDHHGLFHYEGGWPKEVNTHDEESTLRYRKKVEREDSWGIQVANLINNSMVRAQQNNAMDIYQDFFQDLPADLGAHLLLNFNATFFQLFHDIWARQRMLVECNWAPNDSNFFTALHNNIQGIKPNEVRLFEQMETNTSSTNAFYMWNMQNPIAPVRIYDSPHMVTIAYIGHKDDTSMAGGYKTGEVVNWHAIAGGMPLHTCPLEAAHREQVSALVWVHSKSNTEFYTGSLDGSIKYWDNRDLVMPLQELLLEPEPKQTQIRRDAHGVTVMEFEYTIPVRYTMCTDMGYVFVGNRKGMTAVEVIVGAYQLFKGPIRTIQRNPMFVKNFLICGDWRARFWAEECKNDPITMYFKRRNQVMCGAWSPTRCSLFITGDAKGFLDLWDLLLSHREPIYTLRFQHAITSVSIRSDGDFAIASLENGDAHILKMSEAATVSTSKEKALIAAMFEREIWRSKHLEARIEELKKRKRETETEEKERLNKELTEKLKPIESEIDNNDPEQILQLIETDDEFRNALENFQVGVMEVENKRKYRVNCMQRTDFEQYYLDLLEQEPEAASLLPT